MDVVLAVNGQAVEGRNISNACALNQSCEPVWPSGKALG